MNVYQRFALGEYLFAFPEDKSYDEVLDMLLKGSDEVIIWQVFEDASREAVVELIDTLMDGLFATFVPRKEDK